MLTVALLAVLPAGSAPLQRGTAHVGVRTAAPTIADAPRPAWTAPARAAAVRRPVEVAAANDEMAITPPPAAFEGPPPAAAPPPVALRAAAAPGAPSDGVWAVVVGIDDYPGGGNDLRASVADAVTVDAALAAYGVPAERRLVLRDGQATAATIRMALRWLVDRAGAEATAVFFYAGHVRKLDSDTEAIVGADGRIVSDADVAWDLKRLRARQTWIALAACYAGGFTEALAPGRILTGAADSESLAYESSRYGRSYLGEFMIQRAMVNGWAAGSVEQSFEFAQEALRREHPERLLVQLDMLDGELRLGAPPPAQPPPEPPPPPPAPSAPPAPEEPSQPAPPPPPDEEDPGQGDDGGGCLLGVVGSCAD